jgi:transcriptional regulator GlxA family with amidase domain
MKNISYYSFIPYLFFLGIISCSEQQEKAPNPVAVNSPDKILNVALVVVQGVYNSELVAPMDIFHHTVFHTEPGMKVFTVAPDTSVITTFEGLRIIPDYAMDDQALPEIDILVVPSAENSMGDDQRNPELISFVREKGNKASFVISLCDGAFILARAGLVDGKISTTFPTDIVSYKEQFPNLEVLENVSFVHDGKLITSAGGALSYDPALYLCELLYGREVALGIARGLVIDWDLKSIPHVIAKNESL